MAQGRPWYKRSGADFVMATLSMPDAETKWAYSAIIDMLNDRDRPLADDPGFICGFTGLTKQKWGRVRRWLLEHGYLVTSEPGLLTNPRFERERAERLAAHELAVEAGRLGGKKSAQMRAAGQGEMDLGEAVDSRAPAHTRTGRSDIGENLQETDQLSSNFSSSLLEESTDITSEKQRKTAKTTQPPPQALYAREEARDKSPDRSQPDSPHSNPRPDNEAGQDGRKTPGGRLADQDLKAVFDRCCETAGFRPTSPTVIANGMALVEDWTKQGIDLETVVLPTIRAVISDSDQRTRSLHRFRDAVQHQHAKAQAATRKGGKPRYTPPTSPITEPTDEDPALRPIRAQMLEQLGPDCFAMTMNRVRLQIIEDARGHPLRVNGDQHAVEQLVHGNFAATLRKIALKHGFDAVWKGT